MISHYKNRVFYDLAINVLIFKKKLWIYGKSYKWRDLNKTQEFVIVDRPNVRKIK